MSSISDDENDFVPSSQFCGPKRKREAGPSQPRRKHTSVVQGAVLPAFSFEPSTGTQSQSVLYSRPETVGCVNTSSSQRRLHTASEGPLPCKAPSLTTSNGPLKTCMAVQASCAKGLEPGPTPLRGPPRLSCTPSQPATNVPPSNAHPGDLASGGIQRLPSSTCSGLLALAPSRPTAPASQILSSGKGAGSRLRLFRTQNNSSASGARGLWTPEQEASGEQRRASCPANGFLVSYHAGGRSSRRLPVTPDQQPGHPQHVASQQPQNRETPSEGEAAEVCGCCPICGCDLGHISNTATGREAHVNACLDAAARGGPPSAGAMERARTSIGPARAPAGQLAAGALGAACGGEGGNDRDLCNQRAAAAPEVEVDMVYIDDGEAEEVGKEPEAESVPGAGAGTNPSAGSAAALTASLPAPAGCERARSSDTYPAGFGDTEYHAPGCTIADCSSMLPTSDPGKPRGCGLSTYGMSCSHSAVPPGAPGSPRHAAEHGTGTAPQSAAPLAVSDDTGERMPRHVSMDADDEPRQLVEMATAIMSTRYPSPASEPDAGCRPRPEASALCRGDEEDGGDEDWPLAVQQPLPDAWDAETMGTGTCMGGRAQGLIQPPWPPWDVAGEELPEQEAAVEEEGLLQPLSEEHYGEQEQEQQGAGAGEEEEEDVDDDSVAAWLRQHGLLQWLSRFRDGEVDETVVPDLNDADLQGLGIDSPRARSAILAAVPSFGTNSRLRDDDPANAGISAPLHSAEAASLHAQQFHGDPSAALLVAPGSTRPVRQEHPFAATGQVAQGFAGGGGHGARGAGAWPGGAFVPAGPAASTSAHQQDHRDTSRAADPAMTGGGAAKPFAAMFRANPAGPVRITSFFRGGGAESVDAGGGSGAADMNGRGAGSVSINGVQAGGGVAAPGSRMPQQQRFAQFQRGGQRQQQQQGPRPVAGPQRGPGGPATAAGAGGGGGRLPRWVPECHTIPGTRMLVDYFGPPSKNIPPATSPFRILTHFHADHYKGLTRTFAGGTVLASPVTARLVSERLKLPAAKLRVLPMDTPVEVDGVTLTLVDANHCPGAAMVIAQPPAGRPPVLHTGDCRLGEHMRDHPALQALVGRRCTLVLDTTYCDPKYEFPTQRAVLDSVMEAVKAEMFNKRALFVFGTYTIGKERLFLEVAAALGQKVYCSKEKAATLAACGLAPQYASLITTNHLEANIHAVPLFKVTLDGLTAILQQYRGRYSAVIGFSPTGWNHTAGGRGGGNGGGGGRGRGGRGAGRGGRGDGNNAAVLGRQQQSAVIGRRMARGTTVVYQVPYSEHSSFGELRSFVQWLQPGRIVPSVNQDGPTGPKTTRMLELLLGPEGQGAVNAQPPGSGGAAAAAGAAAGAAPAARDIRLFMRGGAWAQRGQGAGGGET